jgi:hypothetical protein
MVCTAKSCGLPVEPRVLGDRCLSCEQHRDRLVLVGELRGVELVGEVGCLTPSRPMGTPGTSASADGGEAVSRRVARDVATRTGRPWSITSPSNQPLGRLPSVGRPRDSRSDEGREPLPLSFSIQSAAPGAIQLPRQIHHREDRRDRARNRDARLQQALEGCDKADRARARTGDLVWDDRRARERARKLPRAALPGYSGQDRASPARAASPGPLIHPLRPIRSWRSPPPARRRSVR